MRHLADSESYKGNFPSSLWIILSPVILLLELPVGLNIVTVLYTTHKNITGLAAEGLGNALGTSRGPHLLMFSDYWRVCCWLLFPGIFLLLTGVSLHLSRLLVNLFWWKKRSKLKRKERFTASMRAMPSILMLPPRIMCRERNFLRWVKKASGGSRENAVSVGSCFLAALRAWLKGRCPCWWLGRYENARLCLSSKTIVIFSS